MRRFARALLRPTMRLGAVVVCAMCRSAVGTTIVAIWTPSEVVIAADSMVSGGRDFAVKGDTCKIRMLGPNVFASAGFVANLPLQVDVYRIAEESVADSPREHAERFATRFIAEMGRVVRWAKEHEPEAWTEYQRNECFQAVFAGVENETPVQTSLAHPLPELRLPLIAGLRTVARRAS